MILYHLPLRLCHREPRHIKYADTVEICLNPKHTAAFTPLNNQLQHVPKYPPTLSFLLLGILHTLPIDNSITPPCGYISREGSCLSDFRVTPRHRRPETQRRINMHVVLVSILHRRPNNLPLVNNTRHTEPQNRKYLLRVLRRHQDRKPSKTYYRRRSKRT